MSNYFNNPFLVAIGFPTRISFDKFCDDYPDEARKLHLILKNGADTMISQCRAIITPIKERINLAEKERKDRAKEEKIQALIEQRKKVDEQHQKELSHAKKQAVEEYKRNTAKTIQTISISSSPMVSSPMIYKARPKTISSPPPSPIICLTCRTKDQEITQLRASIVKRDFELYELRETILMLEEKNLDLEKDLDAFKEGVEEFAYTLNNLKRPRQ